MNKINNIKLNNDNMLFAIVFWITICLLGYILVRTLVKRRINIALYFGVSYYMYNSILLLTNQYFDIYNLFYYENVEIVKHGLLYLLSLVIVAFLLKYILQRYKFTYEVEVKRRYCLGLWIFGIFMLIFLVCGYIKKFFGEIGIDTIIFQLSVPLDGTGEIEKYIYCFIIKVIFQLIFLDSLFFWVFYKLLKLRT